MGRPPSGPLAALTAALVHELRLFWLALQFLTRVPGQNNNDVEGKNSTLNVDASISYQLTKDLQLVLEGVNLTNEANDQFISRARNSPVVYTVTGREYLLGVRMKF